jgi:hypothetical protein
MLTIRFIRWAVQAHLTLTVNYNLRSCLFITRAFMSRSLWTSLMMENDSCNPFSDTSFGSPNIHLVRIKFSLHSKHWELRPLGVSVVHGWAGVAGHLVESLSRICLVRFSLSSCSSLTELDDVQAILGFGSRGRNILLGNIELSEVDDSPGLWICGLVVQGYPSPMYSWHRANSWMHLSDGFHIPIKHWLMSYQRVSGMSYLHLNVQCLERWQSVHSVHWLKAEENMIRMKQTKIHSALWSGEHALRRLIVAVETCLVWDETFTMSCSLPKLTS